MSRKHYDPSIPSVTEIIDPLIREELNKIPKFRLDIAGAKGIQRHKEFDDFIKNQKHCGVPTQLLSQALTLVAPKGKVLSEQYKKINGVLQGTVDVVSDDTMIDHKTGAFKEEAALQLGGGYDMLFPGRANKYVFHYENDYSLSIWKLIENDDLKNLYKMLLDNHEAIKAGEIEFFNAQREWERIKLDHKLFELVDILYPPLAIADEHEAKAYCNLYAMVYRIDKKKECLKNELKRYMQENGVESLEFDAGKLKLQTSNRAQNVVFTQEEFSAHLRTEYNFFPTKDRESFKISVGNFTKLVNDIRPKIKFKMGTKESTSLVFRQKK